MDLGAYAQIADLGEIAEKNGIEIPRLRGYRLMSEEIPVDVSEMIEGIEVETCKELCRSHWRIDPIFYTYSDKTDFACAYYLSKDKSSSVRWERIHGRKRKNLKYKIKQKSRKIKEQYEMWNKYAGKPNVLYIHAKIGGANWNRYGGNELIEKTWFLDKVDDSYDRTYCDIYAAIKE